MELKIFVIVSSSVFGASTALHLVRTKSQYRVVLIDKKSFPAPSAASSDLNKIIRIEYNNPWYMKLAVKAQKAWKKDLIYSKFFHQAPLVSPDNSSILERIIELFKRLGIETKARMLPIDILHNRYGTLLDQANLEGVKEVYVNPLSR